MLRCLLLAACAASLAHAEMYCFGFLNSHPERKAIPEAEANEIQKGHMAHMGKMNAAGHLLVAGPIANGGRLRGILVYRCKSLDEIAEWTALDPAVQNKRLTLEAYRWNGPEQMGEPLFSQMRADPNTKVNMVQLPLVIVRRTEKWTGDGPMDVLPTHGKRVMSLLNEGKMRAAGPFMTADGHTTDPVGIFVFSAMPLDEAKAIASEDPLVKNGYAKIEAYMWFVADDGIPKKH
jgi:uncharacterized protein YciI